MLQLSPPRSKEVLMSQSGPIIDWNYNRGYELVGCAMSVSQSSLINDADIELVVLTGAE